ncbi:MAG: CopD family protein [Burkholderiales bacterium]
MQVARWLHVLGVVVWVGGMFFAHMALRPAAQALPPPQRLPLLAATLSRFVAWAGVAIAMVVGSGVALIGFAGGMGGVGPAVHAMSGLGLAMVAIYAYLAARPLPRLRGAVAAAQWEQAGAAMAVVRRLVGVNLMLGLLTLTVAVLGRG